MASITKQPKEVQERHRAMLLELLKQPGNRECADCRARNPTWASTNLGLFVCIRCSGLHRQVGTHVTKVKSCTMDLWDPEQIAFMGRMGNDRARVVWEAQLSADFGKPSEDERDDRVLEWIRAKYERKRYMALDPEAALRNAPPAPVSAAAPAAAKRTSGGLSRTRAAGSASGGPAVASPTTESTNVSAFAFVQSPPASGPSAFSFVGTGPTSPASDSTPTLACPAPSFASPQFGVAGGFDFGAPLPTGGFTDAPASSGFDFAGTSAGQSGFDFTSGAPVSATAFAFPAAESAIAVPSQQRKSDVLDSIFTAAPAGNMDVFGMPLSAMSPAQSVSPSVSSGPALGFMINAASPAMAVPVATVAPAFPAPVKVDPFAVLAQPSALTSPCQASTSLPVTPAASFAPTVVLPTAVAATATAPAAEDTAAMQRMLEQLQAQQAMLMQQMQLMQLQSTSA